MLHARAAAFACLIFAPAALADLPNIVLIYGDDIGLAAARARRTMELLGEQMGLSADQLEFEGRVPWTRRPRRTRPASRTGARVGPARAAGCARTRTPCQARVR